MTCLFFPSRLQPFSHIIPGTYFLYDGVLYEKTFVSKAEIVRTGEEIHFPDTRYVEEVPDDSATAISDGVEM